MRGLVLMTLGVFLALSGAIGWIVWHGQPRPAPPAIATQIGGTRLPDAESWNALNASAAAGDARAMNDLGVVLWRTPGKDNAAQAKAQFEKAARLGHIQARYNLSVMVPNRRDTPPETVARMITMLRDNVALGDVPSMVRLANWLDRPHAATLVSDHAALRRDLLRQAARTNDADYLLILGRHLWDEVRDQQSAALLPEALSALRLADTAGNVDAAESLGRVLADSDPDHEAAIADSGIDPDPLVWFAKAADAGSVTARCAYGLLVYRPVQGAIFSAGRSTPQTALALVRARHSAAVQARAQAELETCGQATGLPRRENLPFGSRDVYAIKPRAPRAALGDEPGRANLVLGALHGFGLGVPRDAARARQYLQNADGSQIAGRANALLGEFQSH